jgi:hypothetical protein
MVFVFCYVILSTRWYRSLTIKNMLAFLEIVVFGLDTSLFFCLYDGIDTSNLSRVLLVLSSGQWSRVA